MSKTDLLPCLPLRDIVVFPGMLVPLFVGREKSIKALKEVMKTNKKIILVTQKNPEIDDPEEENLYSLGCESKILQLLKLPDGTVKVLVEGLNRMKILECKNDMDFMKIWKSKETLETKNFIKKTNCHCTYECALTYNILGNWRYQPNLMRSLFDSY